MCGNIGRCIHILLYFAIAAAEDGTPSNANKYTNASTSLAPRTQTSNGPAGDAGTISHGAAEGSTFMTTPMAIPAPVKEIFDNTINSTKIGPILDKAGLLPLLEKVGPLGYPIWLSSFGGIAFLLLCGVWSCVASIICHPTENEFSTIRRRPTDIVCLTVFLCFLWGMAYILHYAVVKGDPRRLTHGFNFKGQLCGVSEEVAAKPFLFWCKNSDADLDFSDSTTLNQPWQLLDGKDIINFNSPVCVDACPSVATDTVLCPLPSNSSSSTHMENGKSVTVTTITQARKPRTVYRTKQMMGIFCLPDIPTNSTLFRLFLEKTSMNGPLQKAMMSIGSLRRATNIFMYSAVGAFVLSLLYICLLSVAAECIVFLSLTIIAIATLLVSAYALITAYAADKAAVVPHINAFKVTTKIESILQEHGFGNPLFAVLDHDSAMYISYVVGAVSFFGFLCTVCATCCCKQKLKMAASVVDVAADCMLQMKTMLLEALIDVALRLAALGALSVGLFWVFSCGSVHADAGATIGGQRVTGVSRSLTFTREEKYMIAYYIFGFLWIMELVHALSQFVISYMVVMWYYTPKDGREKVAPWFPLPKAYFAALTCHLGSLAIGSFIIALIRMAKIILGAFSENERTKGNKVMACIASILGCILECFQHCMEFISKNAYIDIAINNSNFCNAAKHSFEFMLHNASEIVVLNGACFVFQLNGVLIVAGLTGFGAHLAMTHMDKYSSNTSPHYIANPIMVVAAAIIIGALISTVFMVLFDQTADTLLYTYTWSKSKQSNQQASYAPEKLLALESVRRYVYCALPNHPQQAYSPNYGSQPGTLPNLHYHS